MVPADRGLINGTRFCALKAQLCRFAIMLSLHLCHLFVPQLTWSFWLCSLEYLASREHRPYGSRQLVCNGDGNEHRFASFE